MTMVIIVEIRKFVRSPVIRSLVCQDKSEISWKRGKQKSDILLGEWTVWIKSVVWKSDLRNILIGLKTLRP